jgi:Flp pilus assembly protein TadD/TolB-like protein
MPETDRKAVFLSYASQDAGPARRLCEALRSAGLEVWFDAEGGIEHGDEWDAKIRKQIRDCVLFIPLISAHTQARLEGYFRIEWDLAAERAQGIAQGVPFILPVVIDDTREPDAFVPDRFRKVQWTRAPDGVPPPEMPARLLKLWLLRNGITPPGTSSPASSSSWPPHGLSLEDPPASPVRSRRRWFALGAVGTALVLAAAWYLSGPRGFDSDRLSGGKQIAVLPFKNIGEMSNHQAFSDGLTETITAQLAQLERFQRTLLVVPMSEVRKEGVDTARLARAVFGANLALSGSVQRESGIMRVTVSLVDTKSLRILRGATFNHPFTESYRLQDRVAAEAAAWLGLELSPEARRELAAGQTSVAAAYESYLRGRGELARRDLPGNLDAAIVHLQQALVSDPRYPLAHAALARAFWSKFSETSDRVWVDEARKSCQAALEFGAALVEPHVTFAVIQLGTGLYEQAEASARTALGIEPANAEATRLLAVACEKLNRPAEAEAAYRRAIEHNPNNSLAHSDLAVFYWNAGRNQEAEKYFLRLAELTPDSYSVYRNLGGLYVMMGRTEEASRLLEKSIALKPTYAALSNLGTLRFLQRDYEAGAKLFEHASVLNPRNHVPVGNLADALRFIPTRAAEAPATYQRAIRLAEQALQINAKDPKTHASLARYCAFGGDAPRARDAITQARSLAPKNLPIMVSAALVHERLGQREPALQALAQALQGGYPRGEIDQQPDLTPVRNDPRLAELLSQSVPTKKQ